MNLAFRRSLGFLVDASVCWVAFALLSVFGIGGVVLNAAIYLAYRALFARLFSMQTIGRALLGVRVQAANGDSLSLSQGLIRELPVALVLVGPLAGGLTGFVIIFVGLPCLLAADAAIMWGSGGTAGLRDLAARTRGYKIHPLDRV